MASELGNLTDEQLVVQAREAPPGRNAYLEELFGRHYNRVSLWCLRYAGNRDEAADLAQEIFLRVQKAIPEFRAEAKFSTWLYTVCRNHCLNRVQARRPEISGEEILPNLADDSVLDIENDLDRRRMIGQAKQWISQLLDETERRVFTLHYGEGMPLDAITRLLGLKNASGAKAFTVSSRRKLQDAVRKWRARNEA